MSGPAAALQANGGWLALVALLLGLIGLLWLLALQKRVAMVTPDVRRLVRDMEGKSIQQVVEDLLGNMEFLSRRLGRLQVASDDLHRSLRGTLQCQGLVRYNADDNVGGELSFALALLDGDQDGVILTSIHTLEECRLYVRNVEHGACAHDLSEEEAAALDMALRRRRPERAGGPRVRRTRWRAKEHAGMGRDPSLNERGEDNAE